MKITNFEDGMTVAELLAIVAQWPLTDKDGAPTEVWVLTARNISNPAGAVIPLNVREDDGIQWGDLLIEPLNISR